MATWLGAGALVVASLGNLFTFLTRRPMVSASTVSDLRAELADLRVSLVAADRKIASLEGSLGQAILEREFWQEKYRAAQEALDRIRAHA